MKQNLYALNVSRRALPWLAGIAAFVALAAPVLDPEVQLFYRDTGRLYYPVKKVIADRLAHGQLALWDPWSESGVSLLGQLTPALLHPATLLYAVFPFDLAFKLNHLLPLLLAGVGTALLARRHGASPWSALAGGATFGGCGFLVSMAASNLPYVMGPSTVPFAIERLLAFVDRPGPGRLAAASGVLALCAYAGEPQSMLIAGLVGTAYVVARALSRAQPSLALRHGALAALWGVCALLLAAPVALPALAMFPRSNRAGALLEAGRFTIAPQRFPGLFIPHAFDDAPEQVAEISRDRRRALSSWPFGEYLQPHDATAFSMSIYLGTPALLLALFAAFAGRRGRFLLVGALVFLIASAGQDLGVQPLLDRFVPGFRLFRYSEKLIWPASLLLALATALGADAAFSRPRRSWALTALAGGSFATLSTVGLWLTRHRRAAEDFLVTVGQLHLPTAARLFVDILPAALSQEAMLSLLVALLALAAALRSQLRGARAVAALLCATAVVLGNAPELTTVPVELFHQQPPFAERLIARAGASEGRWRIFVNPQEYPNSVDFDPKTYGSAVGRSILHPHYDGLFGIEGTGAYFSAADVDYELAVTQAAPAALRLLTARFFVLMPGEVSERTGAKELFERVDYGMWMQTVPLAPRAIVFDRATVVADAAAAVRRMNTPGFDVWHEAVLLPAGAQVAKNLRPVGGRPGRASYHRPSPEQITVEVASSTDSLLSIAEHFDPGWTATVDRKPAPVVETDCVALGVPIAPGRHHVELRFWPMGLTWGLWCAAATAAAVLLWSVLTKRVGKLTGSVT